MFSYEQLEQALLDCAAEPIHQIGQIQAHGALLVLAAAEPNTVLQCSRNCAEFLRLPSATLLGVPAETLFTPAVWQVLQGLIESARHNNNVTAVLPAQGEACWHALAYNADELIVVELTHAKPHSQTQELADLYLQMHLALVDQPEDTRYFEQITALVRQLTGFDRVMLYRFDANWDGEVIAQSAAPESTSYLGLQFPASDIPAQARQLYQVNPVRAVADIDAPPIDILPAVNPLSGQPLNMTYSALRSMSPVHIRYLRHLGVKASMSISLLQNGRLWGLIVCHHPHPKIVSLAMRAEAEAISRLVSAKLASIEAITQRDQYAKASHIIAGLIKYISYSQEDAILDWVMPNLMSLIEATGIILVIDNQRYVKGAVPSTPDLEPLLQWLCQQYSAEILHTQQLSELYPPAQAFANVAAGLLFTPFNQDMHYYIVWLRGEKNSRTQWAGKPEKNLQLTAEGQYQLNPRTSFARWSENGSGLSEPWTYVEQEIATMVAFTLPEGLIRNQLFQQQLVYEAELRIAAAAFDSQEGMVITNANCIIMRVNPAFTQLMGYSAEEVLNQHVRLFISGINTTDFYVAMWQRLCEKGTWRGEILNRRKNGNLIAVYLMINAVKGPNGVVKNYVATYVDITSQKHAQAAIKANRAKSDFLANMSHEIRTPMNGVIGMIDVLQHTALGPNQHKIVNIIRSAAHTQLNILNDILDFSKIESGKMQLFPEPFVLEELIENSCMLHAQFAIDKGVSIRFFVHPAIPSMLEGDVIRIRQIINNLLSNAIKFSSAQPHPGLVNIRVSAEPPSNGSILISITVEDNGIGMDYATQQRIFQKFEQADSSTTRKYGGTGLGLVITQQLIELMGGYISLASEPGFGSKFSVELPLALAEQAAAPPSLIQGLFCLMVGTPSVTMQDICSHLQQAGCELQRISALTAVTADKLQTADLVVWVLEQTPPPSLTQLSSMTTALSGPSAAPVILHHLLIQNGPQREPQRVASHVVQLESNLLSHRALVHAAALASGRMQETVLPDSSKRKCEQAQLTRAEALAQGCLLLVAEDNETNQEVIRQQLNLLGYVADIATDGQMALELLQRHTYALLLCDLYMPVMDGYQLTERIRAQEQHSQRHLPIIALTANALAGEAEHCKSIGMDAYLSKPVPIPKLQATLEKWCPRSPPVQEQAAPDKAEQRPEAVNIGTLQALVGDKPAVINRLLSLYLAQVPVIQGEIAAAVAAKNMLQLGRQMHKLKSSAQSIGAAELANDCLRLEQLCMTNEWATVNSVMPGFNQAMQAVERYLYDYLQQA